MRLESVSLLFQEQRAESPNKLPTDYHQELAMLELFWAGWSGTARKFSPLSAGWQGFGSARPGSADSVKRAVTGKAIQPQHARKGMPELYARKSALTSRPNGRC